MLTVTAVDAAGNPSSCMVAVDIVDGTSPVLSVPADVTYECTVPAMQPSATATDACGLTMAGVTFSDGPLSSMSVPYNFTRTYSATDVNGNTSTGTQLISVTDTGSPTLTITPSSYPLSQNVSCDNTTVAAPTVTATDGCAGSLTVTNALAI